MTPSEGFARRVADACEMTGISERELCRRAGIKSESQIGAARSRGSKLNWDHVSAMVKVLEKEGISRTWLLWDEEPKLSGQELRVGEGAVSERFAPEVEVSTLKNRGKQSSKAASDARRGPGQHGGKAKRLRA